MRRGNAASARTKRKVDEIRRVVRTLDGRSTSAVVDDVLPTLRELLGMEQCTLFLFDQSANEVVGVDRVHLAGGVLPAREVGAIADEHFRRTPIWALYDPKNPEGPQRNRAVVVDAAVDDARAAALGIPAGELERRRAAYETTDAKMLRPIGWSGRRQMRVLLCEDDELVGWLGGTGEAFTQDHVDTLDAVVPAFLTRLRVEGQLERSARARAGLAACLEALPSAAFVVGARGRIVHANARGSRLLTGASAGITAETIADVAAGRVVLRGAEVTPIEGAGQPPERLVVLRDRRTDAASRVADAREAWSLTRREAEVLVELACGAANKEIGARLRCAEATVEVHVTRLLVKSGSTTRLELVARLWAGV